MRCSLEGIIPSHISISPASISGVECWRAEHETLEALRLNPVHPDTRNLLGVIYAHQGETVTAARVWHELLRDMPDYEPARANLSILGSPSKVCH